MPDAAYIHRGADDGLIFCRLFTAVLKQAFCDATSKSTSVHKTVRTCAKEFFTHPARDDNLREICEAAGYNHQAIRSAVRRRLKEKGML